LAAWVSVALGHRGLLSIEAVSSEQRAGSRPDAGAAIREAVDDACENTGWRTAIRSRKRMLG